MPLIFYDNQYEGYIKAGGKRFFIKAKLSESFCWDTKNIFIDWRLRSRLNHTLDKFIEGNSKTTKFPEFFRKLETFIESSFDKDVASDLWTQNPVKAHNLYKLLEKELCEFEEYINSVNLEEGIIHIQVVDRAFRQHKAVLKINENYPKEPIKIISHNLPLDGQNYLQKIIVLEDSNTISTFCKKFIESIEHFQNFWNCVSILDSNCWILDPENPTYKDVTRRIKISDRISVVLRFNPFIHNCRPDIQFLGCHSTVAEFREVLQKNLKNDVWNPENDILSNLMEVLEVTFPSKDTSKMHEEDINLVKTGECSICFMVRLEGEMPSVICDNGSCLSNYHVNCLFNYLNSVPRNIKFFEKIEGECPNCDAGIICPVPALN